MIFPFKIFVFVKEVVNIISEDCWEINVRDPTVFVREPKTSFGRADLTCNTCARVGYVEEGEKFEGKYQILKQIFK